MWLCSTSSPCPAGGSAGGSVACFGDKRKGGGSGGNCGEQSVALKKLLVGRVVVVLLLLPTLSLFPSHTLLWHILRFGLGSLFVLPSAYRYAAAVGADAVRFVDCERREGDDGDLGESAWGGGSGGDINLRVTVVDTVCCLHS